MSRKGSVWLIEGAQATPTQNMKEKNWLDLRKQGIGGSDIAAIMGRSPWSTPLGIYCQKVGLAPDREATEAMEFGSRMESTLRKWAEDDINEDGSLAGVSSGGLIGGFKVLSSPYLYRDLLLPFIANVDGVVLKMGDHIAEEEWAGLELKTVDRFYAKEWDDGKIPDYYRDQVQWYMGVTGLPRWVIGALIGKRFEIRVVWSDQKVIEELRTAATDFWERYVLRRIMPFARAEDGNLLITLYPEASEQIIVDDNFVATIQTYLDAASAEKDSKEQKDAAKVAIEQRIGDAKGLKAGACTATWSRYDVNRVDSKKLKDEYPEVFTAVQKASREGRLTVKKEKKE